MQLHEMDGGPTTEDLVTQAPIHDTGAPAAHDMGEPIEEIEPAPADQVGEVDQDVYGVVDLEQSPDEGDNADAVAYPREPELDEPDYDAHGSLRPSVDDL